MVSNDIKIVFFDVDGTTYIARENYICPSTIEAINTLHEKGILCVVCTGRSRNELLGINKDLISLPFDAYITSGGAEVYLANNQRIFRTLIDKRSADKLRNIADSNADNIDVMFLDTNGSGIYKRISECVQINLDWFNIDGLEIRNFDSDSLVQLSFCAHAEFHDEIVMQLNDVSYIVSSPYSIDVYPQNINKMSGIVALLDNLGLSLKQAMAFGDSENDVEMLREVKLGICMGNGSDDAKESCDYVCEDIHDDGIMLSLKKFGVI